MTILIGLINPDQAIFISDRRLSDQGQALTKDATKTTLLATRDARLCLGFTGIALDGAEFVTEPWLLEALAEAVRPDCLWEPTLQRLAELATRDFTERFGVPFGNTVEDIGLSILAVGYTHTHEGAWPRFSLVSNHETIREEPIEDSLTRFVHTSEVTVGVAIFGSGQYYLPENAVEELHLMNAQRADASEMIDRALYFVARASEDDPTNSVGPDAMSAVLPVRLEEDIVGAYHPLDADDSTAYEPNLVLADHPDRSVFVRARSVSGQAAPDGGPPPDLFPWWAPGGGREEFMKAYREAQGDDPSE